MKKEVTCLILCILISFNCRKKTEPDSCGCKSAKTESIDKIFGIIVKTDDGFEILTDEKGLLIPCSELPADFKVDAKPVIVSGTLKTPCKKIPYFFNLTPTQISDLKPGNANYNKTDITLTIIKSEDYGYAPGFGYTIEDKRSSNVFKILQPHIPAISGFVPFATSDQATKAALLVISLLRSSPGELPSLTIEILQYMDIIN